MSEEAWEAHCEDCGVELVQCCEDERECPNGHGVWIDPESELHRTLMERLARREVSS